MKKVTFLLLAFFVAACGGSDGTDETTTPAGNDGLGVAVTVFAEWQRGSQGNLDGEYDAREALFVPCGAAKGVSIQPGAVKVLSGGSCDGLSKKLEPSLMVIRRSGNNFAVLSHEVTVQDVTNEKGKGQYKTSGGTQQIVVDPETMKRIKAERMRLEAIHH